MDYQDEIKIDDEFEYHDGLGDLLMEKDNREFSWVKLVVVVVSAITVVTLSFMLVVKIGKILMVRTPHNQIFLEEFPEELSYTPKAKEAYFVDDPIRQKPVIKPKSKSKIKPKPKATPKPKTVKVDKKLYRVVVGGFKTHSEAAALMGSLKKKKISCYIWTHSEKGFKTHRVQVGAFQDISRAKIHKQHMLKNGLESYILYR